MPVFANIKNKKIVPVFLAVVFATGPMSGCGQGIGVNLGELVNKLRGSASATPSPSPSPSVATAPAQNIKFGNFSGGQATTLSSASFRVNKVTVGGPKARVFQ